MTDTNSFPCKFLLVGFDGLRPCDITPDVMPNLARFRDESHTWENYLASFPTETYVNHPVIFSGFRPNGHGLIANSFYCPELKGKAQLFCGWDTESVIAQDEARPEGLYAVPDMAELLAQKGKTMRVLCANSAGSTRLQNMHADRYPGHLNACIHALEKAIPINERNRLLQHSPATMPLTFPDFAAQSEMLDILFRDELNNGVQNLADMTVFWIGEPDHSSHEIGLKSELTERARTHADKLFGRIYDWWLKEGRSRNVQLVTMSDHGVGLVFSQPNEQYRDAVAGRVPGTLSEALVFSESVRGPDLRIVGRGDNSTGRILSGGHYSLGCGNHGGLTPAELHAHLSCAGTAFTQQTRRHKAPAGHDDLAKTMLTLMGAEANHSPARVLDEALKDDVDESYGVFTLRLSQGKLSMTIEHAHYAGRRYVLSGEREDGALPAFNTVG